MAKEKAPAVFYEKPQPKILAKVGCMGIDMHFHTEYSADSIAGAESTLKYAKKLGCGLCVTDHNAIGGALRMTKNRYGVPVIPGIELTGREGTHMIYYFYSTSELSRCWKKEMKPYLSNPFCASKPTLELLRDISRYNCVITTPHPYAPGATGIKKLTQSDKDVRRAHAVEVLNGYNLHSLNLKAQKWMERSGKGATGGTDGHMVEELGRVLTFAYANDTEEFLEAVKKRKTTVIGVEDDTLRKVIITLLKEHEMVSKSREYHVAKKLLESQYNSSANFYNTKFSKLSKRMRNLFEQHDDKRLKVDLKRHPLGGSWTRSEQLR